MDAITYTKARKISGIKVMNSVCDDHAPNYNYKTQNSDPVVMMSWGL